MGCPSGDERNNVLALLAEVTLHLGLALSARQTTRTSYELLEHSLLGSKNMKRLETLLGLEQGENAMLN